VRVIILFLKILKNKTTLRTWVMLKDNIKIDTHTVINMKIQDKNLV